MIILHQKNPKKICFNKKKMDGGWMQLKEIKWKDEDYK